MSTKAAQVETIWSCVSENRIRRLSCSHSKDKILFFFSSEQSERVWRNSVSTGISSSFLSWHVWKFWSRGIRSVQLQQRHLESELPGSQTAGPACSLRAALRCQQVKDKDGPRVTDWESRWFEVVVTFKLTSARKACHILMDLLGEYLI